MTIQEDYTDGTVSITTGTKALVGSGTAWDVGEFETGDLFFQGGYVGVIATVNSDTSITLVDNWPGPTLAAVTYRMRWMGDADRTAGWVRELVDLLGNGNVQSLAGLNGTNGKVIMFNGPASLTLVDKTELISGVFYNAQIPDRASRSAYDGQPGPTESGPGYTVLVTHDETEDGKTTLYSKLSDSMGDWSDAAIITGDIGPASVIEVGTTTTLAPGADATLTLTPIVGGVALNLGVPEGEQGIQGIQGPQGDGLEIGATGTLAERDAYDTEPAGFAYVDVPNGHLYIRETATPGVWSDPIDFGKGEKGDTGDSGAVIVSTEGVGDGTAGPYTLNAEPASEDATWAYITGVAQSDFTLDGATITFAHPIPDGKQWMVKSSGVLSIVVPNDGSVGVNQLKLSEAAGIRTALGAVKAAASSTDLGIVVFSGLLGNEIVEMTATNFTAKLNTFTPNVGATPGLKGLVPAVPANGIADGLILGSNGWQVPAIGAALLTMTSVIALQVADNTNLPMLMNTWLADPFDTLTYINVGSSTNLDTSTAGRLRPTFNDTRVLGSNPSSIFGGTPANFNDNNPATIFTSTALGTLTGATVANRRLASLDFGGNLIVTKLEAIGHYLSAGTGTHQFYTSLDGVTWTAYGASFVANTTPTDYVVTGSVSANYAALVVQAGTYSSITGSVGDFNVYKPGNYNNMTIRSADILRTGFTKMRGVIEVIHNVSSAPNSDYVLEFSLANTAAWISAPLTADGGQSPSPVSGVRVMTTAWIDMSASLGDTVRWRIRTLTGRQLSFEGIFVEWAA